MLRSANEREVQHHGQQVDLKPNLPRALAEHGRMRAAGERRLAGAQRILLKLGKQRERRRELTAGLLLQPHDTAKS